MNAPAREQSGRVHRFSAVELLITLVLLFVSSPFVQSLHHGAAIEAALMTLMLISGVLAVGGKRRTLLFTALLATPAVVGRWVHHFRSDWMPLPAYLAASLVFVAFVIVNLLRFVLRSSRVNAEVLCASISAYLMLGLLWALAYTLEAQTNPNAFAFNTPGAASGTMAGSEAFYFSFVTLSTVGYGDITPVSNVARMLAVTEAMTGLLYTAVLISRLVALYSAPSAHEQRDED